MTNVGKKKEMPATEKMLLISSRPFEHSGMTKIEMDVIDYTRDCIDFEVASFDYYCEYEELLKQKGIKNYKLANKNHAFSYMKDIYRLVRKENYNKVYIHGNSSFMILEAFPCKMAGVKVITHCHNTKPTKGYLKYYLMKPFFNLFVDCKIGCSKEAADWAYFGKRIVINNGVDIFRFKYDQTVREEIRHELGLEDNCVVGHIGTFNEQKNHKKLISIFEELIKVKSDARLLLIGDGALKDSILSDITDRGLSEYVVDKKYVKNPEEYIQAMDVMILPSLFEGFCLVALEAQASGLPVIVSEKIPDVAIATDRCIRMNLADNDSRWAEKAIEMLSIERQDQSKKKKKKGYSYVSMLKSIQSILLEG